MNSQIICFTLLFCFCFSYLKYVYARSVSVGYSMGVARNKQFPPLGICQIKNDRAHGLINCVVCRKPRGRPGYDSDQGRKFMFPYFTNTVCDRVLLTYLQNCILVIKMHDIWSVNSQENYWIFGHQMSDFKAKCTKFDSAAAPPQKLLGKLTALSQTP